VCFFGVDESYQEHHKHHFQICSTPTMTNIFENHKITSTAQVTVSYSWAQALDVAHVTGRAVSGYRGLGICVSSPFLPRSSSTRTNPCGCDQQRVWHMRSMPSCTNFCLQIGRTVLWMCSYDEWTVQCANSFLSLMSNWPRKLDDSTVIYSNCIYYISFHFWAAGLTP
jgi:hypothetical protein